MKIHDIEQGTDEWRNVRAGKLTASKAQAIGNNGKGLETYVYETLAELYSSGEYEHYTNPHIERGNELEDAARSMYELETGNEVRTVGFVEMDAHVGCSPDGLVGDDGGIEIKCHSDAKHLRLMANGEKDIDTSYLWQVQMNLLVTGRTWWDLIAYNPNFEKSLIIFRITPDSEKQEKLKAGLKRGKQLLKDIKKKL